MGAPKSQSKHFITKITAQKHTRVEYSAQRYRLKYITFKCFTSYRGQVYGKRKCTWKGDICKCTYTYTVESHIHPHTHRLDYKPTHTVRADLVSWPAAGHMNYG